MDISQQPPAIPAGVESVRISILELESGRIVPFGRQRYDRAGRLIEKSLYTDEPDVTAFWEFDFDDRHLLQLERRRDRSGTTVETVRHTHTLGPDGRIVESVASSSNGGRRTVRYDRRDDGSWTELISNDGTPTLSKSFDVQGRLIQDYWHASGASISYAYDEHGNVSAVREEHAEGHSNQVIDNRYDDAGRLMSVRRNGLLEVTYEYLPEGEVGRETRYGTNGRPSEILVYDYTYRRP